MNLVSLSYDEPDVRLFNEEFIIVAIQILAADSTICEQPVERDLKRTGSNQVTLELESGAGRFESTRSDLKVNIETVTATVNSVSQNDFAVGYDPDADVTIAACYKGSVTVDPANPALSPVTLMKGQQVKVWSDRLGPITNIGQIMPGTILLLLGDGAK